MARRLPPLLSSSPAPCFLCLMSLHAFLDSQGICLPALIFSSIVPSFNSSNINSIGPLLMTAIFYEVCGLIMAFLIREVFWVPHNFQYGILIIGGV